MVRLLEFWESMRATYWAVPSAMAVVAVGLSLAMVALDEIVTARALASLSWVYTGSAEGARAVLSTIASSMITVAGVTFSITIVALTLASQQFGPRLLRNFLRDPGNQIVLGTFVSTYLYCLLVLRTVRGTDDTDFVPHLAVTGGVVLAMLSLGVLIFFIHHVATSIQVSQVIGNVAADLDTAIDQLFPSSIGDDPEGSAVRPPSDRSLAGPPLASGGAGPRSILATAAGYLQAVDSERLMNVAADADVVLRLDVRPGAFVRSGSGLLSVWPAASVTERLDASLRSAFIIGVDRSPTQDVSFYMDQLVDVALRALSPGINDPATARSCVDRLEGALCQLARRHLPSGLRVDASGDLRVIAAPLSFPEMIDVAFSEIMAHAESNLSVTCRVLDALGTVGACVSRPADRKALGRRATAIGQRSEIAFPHAPDRARIDASLRAALALLDGQTLDRADVGEGTLDRVPPRRP